MDQDDIPCRNLNTNASIVNISIDGDNGVSPKPIIESPMEHTPPMSINFLPMFVIILPTIGEPKMTATEYMQKMYPITDISMPHCLSSRGRNGTTSEYQLLDNILAATSPTTSHLTIFIKFIVSI